MSITAREWLDRLIGQLSSQGFRGLVVLSGDVAWSRTLASDYYQQHQGSALWVGEQQAWPTGALTDEGLKQCLLPDQAKHWLGTETRLVVYDAWSGLHVNALTALAGTITAGGLLVLLAPPWRQWANLADPESRHFLSYPQQDFLTGGSFICRLQEITAASTGVFILHQNEALPALLAETGSVCWRAMDLSEQQQAVDGIIKVANGHARRPLVLIADRGRGKSAAMGLATMQLQQQRSRRIIVTGPNKAAVASVIKHAGASAPEFVAIDQLLSQRPDIDLLLIDEAAAIPGAVLKKLLYRYNRIVFATTVHGYEGSGKGFNLRFRQELDHYSNQWQQLQLQAPIRWREGDPLERWLNEVFLLDAESNGYHYDPKLPLTVRACSQKELLQKPDLLTQVFALLIDAHYQTTPQDLRQLLQAPDIKIYLALQANQVLGVVMAVVEGGLPETIRQAVRAGKRRVHGHQLAQTLLAQNGQDLLARCPGLRVMRIAVQPQSRRVGVAKALLVKLEELIGNSGYQWLGTSFAADESLVQFWASQGFVPIRLGFKCDAASGQRSLLMLKKNLLSTAQQQLLLNGFEQQFRYWLLTEFRDLSPAVAVAIHACFTPVISLEQLDEIEQRLCDMPENIDNYLPLLPVLCGFMTLPLSFEEEVLWRRVMHGQSWKEITWHTGIQGRKHLAIAAGKGLKHVLEEVKLRFGDSRFR